MNIQIQTIKHKDQRYPTVGDWQFDKEGNLSITISSMKNWKYECLVGLHELIEVLLCKDRNITQKQVDRFDVQFEKKRKKGDVSEPGDDKKAPYYFEHQFASMIERDMARQLKVDWNRYESKVNSL